MLEKLSFTKIRIILKERAKPEILISVLISARKNWIISVLSKSGSKIMF
jgi:hypothetical protein